MVDRALEKDVSVIFMGLSTKHGSDVKLSIRDDVSNPTTVPMVILERRRSKIITLREAHRGEFFQVAAVQQP